MTCLFSLLGCLLVSLTHAAERTSIPDSAPLRTQPNLQMHLSTRLKPPMVEEKHGTGELDPQDRSWVGPMQEEHARFTGRRGTFAQFGDSITATMAFWSPLRSGEPNASPAVREALSLVRSSLRPECWQEWKGPEFGSEGGRTVGWAQQHVTEWLARLNPEVALVMFGTNDLPSLAPDEYRARLRSVVQTCLDHGTVVILSTIPPRHGYEEKAAAFAAVARELAGELRLPLVDFHAEVLRRRPDDWDGALDRFQQYEGYEVPTLLARDGVHPSYPARYQNDYSPEALRSCGYSLRNYLVLMKYAEVLHAMSEPSPEPVPSPAPGPDRSEIAALRPPDQPWFPQAPPLPPPTGEVIHVSTVDELFAAAARVQPGGTILLADGHYLLPRRLELRTDRVTLRGASGRRERVILDGGGTLGEAVALTACSDVTIADLTVQNVRWNGIKINSETGVQRLVIYRCLLHNIWQRAIKGVLVPPENREKLRPTGCRIEYCLFYNDRPKQFSDDPADTPQSFNGNYIGGIDVMFVRGWSISDNVFVGIHGRTGEARGAIFVWHDSEDCLIERNVIVDCDSGICLGNSHRPPEIAVHCRGCLVRNNFVTRAHENGILADYTRDCRILHNTVHDPESRLGRLIRLVHDNDGLLVANNLLSGPPLRNESTSRIQIRNNLTRDMTAAFVDPAAGNLRLTAKAAGVIERGERLADVLEDIDRTPRGPRPTIGACELRAGGRS